jgi:hypothetical protein
MAVASNLNGSLTQVYDGLVLIQEQSLSGDAASVSFTSIPQTGFSHLKLVCMGRMTEAVTDNYLLVQFNGDTGANYDTQFLRAINTAIAGATSYGATSGRIGDWTGSSATTGTQISNAEISIPSYAGTTFDKSLTSTSAMKCGTSGSNMNVFLSTVHWRSTAAINRIDILPSANNIKAGSVFSLYGVTSSVGATLATGDTNMNVYGRLTTESLVPVSTTARTSQATIYFTPYNGASFPLYNGTRWVRRSFSEISLALSGLTSGKNYDVFVYDNAGTPTLELSAAWASDTARTDAIALQNGVYVKSGTPTRLHLGTMRTTSTTTIEDSLAKRFLWNRYNQAPRFMFVTDTTNSWTYSTATLRQANSAAANQLDYVVGDALSFIQCEASAFASTTTTGGFESNVGIDSTTVGSAQVKGAAQLTNAYVRVTGEYKGYPGLGRHALVWLEAGAGSGTQTFFGDDGGPFVTARISAISGTVWN